ncbi:MAG: MATE family efflux transporter [Treponema sp.]|nr:MATE family efflux transporter [Treponema sp.]
MTYNLTKGSISKNIILFSLPFLLSYFLQTLYGLADLFIVGQFNSADVISAVAIGSQIMHMITVIIVGLATGTTVLISRAVGAGKTKDISGIIGSTIILFSVIAVIASIVLLLFTSAIVSVMSTPSESVIETKRYLRICFAGIPFIIAYNIISSIFRGMGDSKSPMIFIAIACILNIVLDYVFIGIFGMGASGAAYGTVAAQGFSVLCAACAIKKFDMGIHLSKKDFSFAGSHYSQMMSIGLPIAAQDGFIQVSFLLITVIANRRGVDVAAAVGIVEKIICFLFLVPSTVLSAVSAISAQNIGAGEYGRAKKTLFAGASMAAGIGVFFALVFQLASRPVLSFFTEDETVIELGTQYLKTYVFDCVFAGIHFPFSGFFSAYGFSIVSFIHNVCSIIVVRIPGAYLAAVCFPKTLYAMGLAAPLGSLLSVLICIFIFAFMQHKGKFDRIS